MRQFFSRHVASFSRERLPFERRTRTTQEKPISESFEVTAPRGRVRAKGDISLHNDQLLHNVNSFIATVRNYVLYIVQEDLLRPKVE